MKHITEVQRYKISAYPKTGRTQQKIAAEIGVSQAAISKELRRNKTDIGHYSAKIAQEYADFRKVGFSKNRKFTPEIEKIVRQKNYTGTVVARADCRRCRKTLCFNGLRGKNLSIYPRRQEKTAVVCVNIAVIN